MRRADGWVEIRTQVFADYNNRRVRIVKGPHAGIVADVESISPTGSSSNSSRGEPHYYVRLPDGRGAYVRWDLVEGAPDIPEGATEPVFYR